MIVTIVTMHGDSNDYCDESGDYCDSSDTVDYCDMVTIVNIVALVTIVTVVTLVTIVTVVTLVTIVTVVILVTCFIPRPPLLFCSSVCVQYNTWKWKNAKMGKAWEHLSHE